MKTLFLRDLSYFLSYIILGCLGVLVLFEANDTRDVLSNHTVKLDSPRRLSHFSRDHAWVLFDSARNNKVNWALQGVFLATEPQHSTVVLADPGSNVDIYRTGDTLPDAWVVQEIFKNRIILAFEGETRELMLPLVSKGIGK